MAAFLFDTFTDTATTALGSHTGQTGATWTKSTTYNTGAAEISDANRARSNNANVVAYLASGTPGSANYTVATKITAKSVLNPGYVGLIARSDGNQLMFYANHDGADGKWHLYSSDVTGGTVEIGNFTQTLSAGVDYWAALKCVGTAISLSIDGIVRASGTSSVATAAGKAGVIFYQAATNTTGLHADTVIAGAFAISASPSSLDPGTTGNAVTLTGTDTKWATTSPTIAIATTGSGAAITSQTINSDTSIALTIDAGTTGTITLTDPQTGATTAVSVGSRYNLTLIDSPIIANTAASYSATQSAANFGNALDLNGTSQYATLNPLAFAFSRSQTWTYRFRFRSTSAVGLQIIAGLGGAALLAGGGWWIGVNAGILVASLQGMNGGTPFGTASVSDSAWHNGELDITSTGSVATLYVDGTAAGTQAGQYAGFDPTINLNASIGAYNTSDYGYAYFFQGQLDTSGVFDIAAHTSGYTPSTTPIASGATGIRALWHFDGNGFDTSVPAAPTSVTLTGPTAGPTGSASTAFTGTLDSPATLAVTLTPAGTVGTVTFSPSTPVIPVGSNSITFSATASSNGTHVVTATNNRSLSNVGSVSYVTTAVKYTRVDALDPIGGQNIMVLVPSSNSAVPYAGAATGVILYAHGMGETETGLLTDSLKATCVDALLDAGYILAGTSASLNNMGNQVGIDAYAGLDKYVRANYNVANVAIWSQSMGGLAGLTLLAQNKVRGCVGWLGTYPMVSLNAAYTGTGAAAFASYINAAYGITGAGTSIYANKTYGHDPCLMNGIAFRNVPMRFYASASDTVVVKANNTDVLRTLVLNSCGESTVVVCTGEHGDASHFQPSDYVAFFARCFASPVSNNGLRGSGFQTAFRVNM